MQQRLFTFLLLLLLPLLSYAQTGGDECVDAIRIDRVSNFCSDPDAFSNANATQSPETQPTCFPPTPFFDVWFVFTARASDVSISVVGAENVKPGGTLRTPQFELYTGTCGNLQPLTCTSPLGVATTAQSFTSDLVIGQDYYIRVSAAVQRRGTFQLCINNFNAIPDLSSDCSTGLVLCDKSPFSVPSVTTDGLDPDEIQGIFCGNSTNRVTEEQSTWFKWICEQPGTLEFDISPVDPDDDIDFVLYELPNGLDDCSTKQPVRIMLSGMNNGDPSGETWADCIGVTGLRAGDDDEREDCGCATGTDNNFARPVDMVAGRAYALVILNFTQSTNGFTIDFGGTGTFRGPEVDFTTNLIDLGQASACVGQEITLTDASSFAGGLTDWEWNFGPNASLPSADSEGPHNVSFNRPGIQSVLLSVTSVDGCVVSQVVEVEVVCCDDHFSVDAAITDVSCPDSEDGAIDLSAASDFGVTDIEWDIGSDQEDLNNLARGPYEVIITDNATCTTTRIFEVGSPDTFSIVSNITMPTCDGGTDGAINLDVQGAEPPYRYNWQGSGFVTDNFLDNLMVGDYSVTVTDTNNCETERVIEVRELELVLDPTVSTVIPPSCTGFMDGRIEVSINNGLGPYEFDWQDNRGFQDENSLVNIDDGIYNVQVRDANRCLGNFQFNVLDPSPVAIDFTIDPVSCFGESDAIITANGTGGTSPYQYNWDTGGNTSSIRDISAGDYTLTITDLNGCEIDTTFMLDQPDTIFFNNIQVEDVLCFGDTSGRISILGGGGTPPYDFRLTGQDFIPDNTFLNLPAGSYNVELRDAEGCSITSMVDITEPPLLTVDAGEDRIVELGNQTPLEATPNENPVTYLWSPIEDLTCSDCNGPLALPLNSTTYVVRVTNPSGCTAEDAVTVTVAKPRRIYVPTAFSPNNDGSNDFFTIYADDSATRIVSLRIFDRWGELLFNGTDLPIGEEALGWDGTFKGQPLNGGVYVYMAEIEFLDRRIIVERGDVALIR